MKLDEYVPPQNAPVEAEDDKVSVKSGRSKASSGRPHVFSSQQEKQESVPEPIPEAPEKEEEPVSPVVEEKKDNEVEESKKRSLEQFNGEHGIENNGGEQHEPVKKTLEEVEQPET